MQQPMPSNQERRTSLILLQYWNELRGERDFPHEDELDPERLPQVWDHCFLIQVRDIQHVKDYNYTYFGPALLDAYQLGLLDAENGKMVAPDANRLARLFAHVLNTRDPLMDEGSYLNDQGRVVKFRQSLMPLGNSEGVIESILGGAWFILQDPKL